jgi:hypothetical protein
LEWVGLIEYENFTNAFSVSETETSYRNVNFAHSGAALSGSDWIGQTVSFDNASGSLIFNACNLTNFDIPSGATVTNSNTSVIEAYTEFLEFDVDGLVTSGSRIRHRYRGYYNTASGQYLYEASGVELEPWI